MEKRGGEYQDFPSEIFCLTLPKVFVGEPNSVSLFLEIDKFYAPEGYVTTFCRKFFVSRCRIFLVRDAFSFSLVSCIEKC